MDIDDDNLISSDGASSHSLDASQRGRLVALLNTLIPGSDDPAMPGAGDLACAEFFTALPQPEFLQRVEFLNELEGNFETQPLAERVLFVQQLSETQPDAFRAILNQAYGFYYQDPDVMRRIGMIGGAPFPHGNSVPAGDLSLLDPVIAANHRYRKA